MTSAIYDDDDHDDNDYHDAVDDDHSESCDEMMIMI